MKSLFFLWGLLIPMPAIAINSGTNLLAIANFVLVFIIVVGCYKKIWRKKTIIIDKTEWLWYLFSVLSIMTLFISFFNLSGEWLNNSFAMTIKNITFILMILMVFSKRELLYYRPSFIKGLYYSALINLVWAFLQMYFGYVLGVNINEAFFSNILHLDGGIDWNQNVSNNIVYRMSGLSWEPANFGFIANVGYVLSEKKYLKFIFAMAILLSTSKTGMVCLAIILIASVLSRENSFVKKIYKISLKKVLISMVVIPTIILLITYYYFDTIIVFIDRAVNMIDLLITALTTTDNESANIHKLYYEQIFTVYGLSDISNVILGCGMFCAGYPYAVNHIVPYSGIWNPESDFITLFVGNGILGGIIYYLILIRGYIYNNSHDIKNILLIVFVAGILYLQCKGWMIPLVLLSIADKEEDKTV